MTNELEPQTTSPREPRYEIRVEGHLSEALIAAFIGATAERRSDGTTALRLPAGDQAALHAALRTVRDLGLTLRCVARYPPASTPPPP
jgi:hypothetical protein